MYVSEYFNQFSKLNLNYFVTLRLMFGCYVVFDCLIDLLLPTTEFTTQKNGQIVIFSTHIIKKSHTPFLLNDCKHTHHVENTSNYVIILKLKQTHNEPKNNSNQKNVKSGVSALSSTSSSFGTAAASTRFDSHTNGIDETIKAQALAEEEAAMNQYKVCIVLFELFRIINN